MSLNIKELRIKFGLSQKSLSDKTGIPLGRINNWEQGKGSPKHGDYTILSNFFNSLDKSISSGLKVEEDTPQYLSKDALIKDLYQEIESLKKLNTIILEREENKNKIIVLLEEKVKWLESKITT
jgi:transcriptional regulator with XRE-family HTH domain